MATPVDSAMIWLDISASAAERLRHLFAATAREAGADLMVPVELGAGLEDELGAVVARKSSLEGALRAQNDLKNLMAGADFAAIYLDRALRVRRFSPRLTDVFDISSTDEGRPITEFSHRLNYDGFVDRAQEVMHSLEPVEDEVEGPDGRWFRIRIGPYRTAAGQMDGVVATFADITDRRHLEKALHQTTQRALQEARLVELSRAAIFMWDFDDGIVKWNRGSEELYGYTRAEALGRDKDDLLKTCVPGSSIGAVRQALAEHDHWHGQLEHRTKTGEAIVVDSVIEVMRVGTRNWLLESARDITAERRWQRRRQLLLGELSHRVSNTLTIVQSVARQTQRTTSGAAEFVDVFEGRIGALARSHRLLVEERWEGADLARLIRVQLAPHLEADGNRLRFSGPPVTLPPQIATPMGMVLHELAANAAKYGAFSVSTGQVTLGWALGGPERRRLEVVWQERGGPPVSVPCHNGFGGTIIERSIPGATVKRDFPRSGAICIITLDLPDDEEAEYAR